MRLTIKTRVPEAYDQGRMSEIAELIEKAVNQQAIELWTPTIAFATPGNLAVTYSTRVGYLIRFGRLVFLSFNIQTSAFTHTTASGDLQVTGVPVLCANMDSMASTGAVIFQGITKANYTDFLANVVAGLQYMVVYAGAQAQGFSTVKAADMPTGGSVVLAGSLFYFAAEAP